MLADDEPDGCRDCGASLAQTLKFIRKDVNS